MKLTEITTTSPKEIVERLCKQYNIKNYKINSDGVVDVNGDVDLSGKRFSTLPLKFGKVTGNFNCHNCLFLTSLTGAPSEVGGNFICHNCPKLISLIGAPSKVGSSFYCGNCPNLISLEGAPNEITGNFSCYDCPNLTSLEGAPSKVGGNFICHNFPKLTKLSHLVSINGILKINYTSITNLLIVFGIENLKEIEHNNKKITNIINKHLKNPDRDEGMIECRQELRDAGFNEYARIK